VALVGLIPKGLPPADMPGAERLSGCKPRFCLESLAAGTLPEAAPTLRRGTTLSSVAAKASPAILVRLELYSASVRR
jgi:hypothetical protein